MTVKRFDVGSWLDSPMSRRRLDLSQFSKERVVVAEICTRVAADGDQALRELGKSSTVGSLALMKRSRFRTASLPLPPTGWPRQTAPRSSSRPSGFATFTRGSCSRLRADRRD